MFFIKIDVSRASLQYHIKLADNIVLLNSSKRGLEYRIHQTIVLYIYKLTLRMKISIGVFIRTIFSSVELIIGLEQREVLC